MKIKKYGHYRIKGKSKYFANKYTTSNPEIIIEDTDYNVFGTTWRMQLNNPACILFANRANIEGLPISGNYYYGHIQPSGLAEIVHESELEELNEANNEGVAKERQNKGSATTVEKQTHHTEQDYGYQI